jgi:hypothetical protein
MPGVGPKNRKPPPGSEKIGLKADPIFKASADACKVMTGSMETPDAGRDRQVYIGYKPRSFMVPFHQRTQRFSCVVAHRRAGKTLGSLVDTIHRALKNTRGDGRYAFCGPTYAQIKDVVWHYLKQYTYPLPNTKVNEAELSVRLPNSAQIRLYSLDSTAYDRMRGVYLDGCTIDEYADCDPRAVPEVIRPALADRQGWLSIIGTSRGRDAFYQVYRDATKNPQSWFSMKLRASETNALPAEEIAQMRAMMGPNEFARELECSFDVEGYDQLIPGYMIDDAIARKSHRDPNQPVVFGLDVARFGDDRTVLIVREGDRLVEGRVWRGQDLMQTAQQVANLAGVFSPRMIFVDGVGVGGGVIDRLRHLGHTNVEDVNGARRAFDGKKYCNLRAECYARMKLWLAAQASIHDNFPLTEEFEEDATSLNYLYDTQGRLQIESKDDLKAKGLVSPDVSDAVALTFAELLPTADVSHIVGQKGGGYAAPLADPLADW